MANILNLAAEIGANMIGDDAQPTLQISNSSTGPGLWIGGLVATSTASIDKANIPTLQGSATEGVPVTIGRTVLSSPTVAVAALNLNSTASAPVFDLQNQAFVSAVSIVFAASGNWAGIGAMRVKHGDNYKWIPLLPDAVVTAAAR